MKKRGPKVGDYVVCNIDHVNYLTKGKVYKLLYVNNKTSTPIGYQYVIEDDEGDQVHMLLSEFIHIGPDKKLSKLERAIYGVKKTPY